MYAELASTCKRNRGKPLAHAAHDLDIPARRDLQLDPAIAFLLVTLDLIEERLDLASRSPG